MIFGELMNSALYQQAGKNIPCFFTLSLKTPAYIECLERLCRDNLNNVVGKTGHYKQYLCINQFTVNLKPAFSFSFKVESKLGLQNVERLYIKNRRSHCNVARWFVIAAAILLFFQREK